MTHSEEWELQHLHLVEADDLMFCGCGDPEAAWDLVISILKSAPLYQDNGLNKVIELCGSEAAAYIVLYLMTHANLLEHGGSVGGSWITDKGSMVLDMASRHDFDSISEAGYPHSNRYPDTKCRGCWPNG